MALCPVVLEFANVAADASLNFTITTPDVAWSLGDGTRESLGFSYNARTLDQKRTSCIKRIEVTNSVLAIETSQGGSNDPFTLTLFADINSSNEWLQGYCTLNDNARVMAYFGDGHPVEWRNGQFSVLVPKVAHEFRRVSFSFRGLAPEQRIRINLAEDPEHGTTMWCFGPTYPTASSFCIRSANDEVVQITWLQMSANEIVFTTGQKSTWRDPDLVVEAYLIREIMTNPVPLDHVHLSVDCDTTDTVIAQVGTQRPQFVGSSFTVFRL